MEKDIVFFDERVDIGDGGKALDTSAARQVFAELESYLGRPMREISREYWQEKESEEKRVIDKGNKDEIAEYYRTTGQFVYQLAYWEAMESKQREFKKIYQCCRRFGINKLLDFGGGVGSLSIFLSRYRLHCDYLDVPGKTFDFAGWRIKKRGLPLLLFTDARELPQRAYDAVVAYDVLEHLFDVEEALRQINRALKDRGYLITRSSFATEGDMHLPKNRKFQDIRLFDTMMRGAGFVFLGQVKPDYLSQLLKMAGLKNRLPGIRLKRRLKYGGNFIVYRKEK